ncbi:RNA polymerase sigma-70 factor (ECF subfamily) [Dyadobacter jejuensis]|uniref:RNA polymerase sigma-70 factor (ECF subfamily) n=1 Tax=Dyadobacter jejuensis TaxID=1082580 RepID=A0A316AT00_9BACT|nr:RNA polymerase sigma factor [Dyadobacter jejuensis]PWJ59940.1 RNA polymerase sigma-70 factor (ECF subfamily) [Dyadobacter jejuensis]
MENSLFKEFYEEYKSMVYNLALGYVPHMADAQDITQEVFVKLYQHHSSYDPAKASLKTWVYRVTINHCLDFIKAKRRQKRFGLFLDLFRSESGEKPEPVAPTAHPGLLLEEREGIDTLMAAIQQLPEKQKTVIILLKIEDRSQKEVAEIMEISVKAVESLFQRAKTHLAKKLEI